MLGSRPLPLSRALPLAILAIGVVFVVLAFLVTRPFALKEVLSEARTADLAATARMQTLLEAATRFANPVFVQEAMSVITETDVNTVVMVIDDQRTIVASSEFRRITQSAEEHIPPAALALIPKALSKITPVAHFSEVALELTTMARVCSNRSMAREPGDSCNIVVFHRDLGPTVHEHLSLLRQQVLINAGGVLLAAFATILLLQRKLIRPIQHLLATLKAYEGGDTQARIKLSGEDEVASVAMAVNELLDYVQEVNQATEFSEQRFRAMFENNTEGMVVMTEQGFITNINATAEEMFGYHKGELMGARVERLMPDADAGRHNQYVTNYTDSGHSRIIGGRGRELTGKRKNGDLFPLKIGVSEVKSGEVRYFVATLVDLTEITQLEKQLQRSQKMDAIGQLAGGIAHDFNNLLGIVIGNLDLLRRKAPDDPNLAKHIEKALGAATRGAELTRRLLGFSRQKVGQVDAVDVNATISGLEQLLDRSVTARIDVELALADNVWSVQADQGQLEDVFINLTLNARDAMPEGGRLIIETENYIADKPIKADLVEGSGVGEFVLISFSDTGHGISPELREKIFEPFFTTKEEGKGTGLGLSMVYGFLKRFQGCLALYSEVGMGTTFRLYLPRARIEGEQSTKVEISHDLPRGSETILVVDDEEDLVELATDLLSGLGYTILTAANGLEAKALLEARDDVNLLFTDVVMPGKLSGFDLANWASEIKPTIKILLASGFTGRVLAGGDASGWQSKLLVKPYRDAELAQRIRAALDED